MSTEILRLLALTAKAQAHYENLQAQVNRIEEQIKAQFPDYADMKQALKDAQLHLQLTENELKMQAVIEHDPLTAQTTRGAIVLQERRLVTHFDENKAVNWAQQNNRLDLLKLSANKSKFQGALDNGVQLDEDIIKVEMVTLASVYAENLRQFANLSQGEAPSAPEELEEVPF